MAAAGGGAKEGPGGEADDDPGGVESGARGLAVDPAVVGPSRVGSSAPKRNHLQNFE